MKLLKHFPFAILILMATCSVGQDKTKPVDVSAEEFKQKLGSLENEQVLDVRTPSEWKSGTIAGAVKMNFFDDNFEQQLEQLDKSKPVLVYCASGGRSYEAAEKLIEKGFREVYNLENGIQEWKQAGYSVE